MRSTSPVPTTASTSGTCSRIWSRNRSTRHPATMSLRAAPNFLCSAISRIASTDSFCADSMKLHVLTTRISASSARGVSSYPSRVRIPIITSLSTRFFGHPRLTNPTLVIGSKLAPLRNSSIVTRGNGREPNSYARRKSASNKSFIRSIWRLSVKRRTLGFARGAPASESCRRVRRQSVPACSTA